MSLGAKSKLLDKISCEMRAPLNNLMGLSRHTLETGGLNNEARDNLTRIYGAGSILLDTVNDLTDICRIKSGELALAPVEYEFTGMIKDAVMQTVMRKNSGVKFILNADPKIPSRLFGDDIRIKRIIRCLLSNAFRFTAEGFVELNAGVESADDNPALVISVRDTGPGILQENIDFVFAEYAETETVLGRQAEGAGVGLYVAKSIIAMMDGAITVRSEYGKGSVFTARFPQKNAGAGVIGPQAAAELNKINWQETSPVVISRPRVFLPDAKILVVDDLSVNHIIFKNLMKPYGAHIDCANSGQEAVDAIRAEKVRYNAVFMDQMMPGMDGAEAVRIIRNGINTVYAKTVPVIALTANDMTGENNLHDAGFQACLTKPIDIAQLEAVLEKYVCAGGSLSCGGLDVQKGIERFNGDIDSYRQVLAAFVPGARGLLENLNKIPANNSGQKPADLPVSLADYAITVHGLKGSCRGIYAEAAGDMAEALERAAKAGDLDFVIANNQAFAEKLSELIAEIEKMFGAGAKPERPVKKRPDSETLSQLLAACEKHDIEEIDAVINEIDRFEYSGDDGLVLWLRENAEQMNYPQIMEKLKKLSL